MLNNELNKNPFTVPDNYFDHLPAQVQERYTATKKQKANSGIWSTVIKPRLAYAGGLGALALIAYGGFSLINNSAGDINSVNYTQENKTKLIPANSFLKSNGKTYAQGNESLIHVVNNADNEKYMNEDVINYLATEDIDIEDILGF